MLDAKTFTLPFGKFKGELALSLVEKQRSYLVYLVEKTNLADAKKDLLIKLLSGTEYGVPTYEPQPVASEREICERLTEASSTSKIEFVEDEQRIFLKDSWRGHFVYLMPTTEFYDQFLTLLRDGRRTKVKLKFTHVEVLAVVEALTRRRKLRLLVN